MPDNVASSPAGRSLPSINTPSMAARTGSPISAPTCAMLGSVFMAALSDGRHSDATRNRETLPAACRYTSLMIEFGPADFVAVAPEVPYFGTPVAVVSTLNLDG